MSYLPAALLQRCRDLLLTCDQFESPQALRSALITNELCEFKFKIPFAKNQEELVDGFVGCLLEDQLKSGRPSLQALLATLQDKYTDARREQLKQLLEEIRAQGQPAPAVSVLSPDQKQELRERLLNLDFGNQVQQFKKIIHQYRIAAFLVHGPPSHGQQVLTHRLSRYDPDWENAQRFVIEASSPGIGFESDSLWRQVAKKMGLAHDTNKQTLAENVCEWWKTQDVIFVFLTVDYIPRKILVAWLDEFWKPITAMARQHPSDNHLLLFLVDFKGHVSKIKGTFVDQPEKMSSSHAPLKLPPTAKFPKNVLEGWIENSAELLPSTVNAIELRNSTKNGIPNLVYQTICDYCGLSWEGDVMP